VLLKRHLALLTVAIVPDLKAILGKKADRRPHASQTSHPSCQVQIHSFIHTPPTCLLNCSITWSQQRTLHNKTSHHWQSPGSQFTCAWSISQFLLILSQ